MLLHMHQISSSLLGHLEIFIYFFFTFMEQSEHAFVRMRVSAHVCVSTGVCQYVNGSDSKCVKCKRVSSKSVSRKHFSLHAYQHPSLLTCRRVSMQACQNASVSDVSVSASRCISKQVLQQESASASKCVS